MQHSSIMFQRRWMYGGSQTRIIMPSPTSHRSNPPWSVGLLLPASLVPVLVRAQRHRIAHHRSRNKALRASRVVRHAVGQKRGRSGRTFLVRLDM